MTIKAQNAPAPPPDVERFRSDVAALPPDADLARRGEELAAAFAALRAEEDRAPALRRRRAAIAGALPDAVGADRAALLQELLLVDADEGTVPAGIAAAVRAYTLARLAWLDRLIAVADAEARRIVDVTNGSIGDLDRLQLRFHKAQGYTGSPPKPAEAIAALRAEVEAAIAGLRPPRERHARATQVAAMARAVVAMAYGEEVASFARVDRTTRSWAAVAERAAEAAAERARRAEPVGRAA